MEQSENAKTLKTESLQDKVCVVIGTRPSIIKMSPIVRALQRHDVDYFILHTGQHYSYEMDRKFFEDLDLPEPLYHDDHASQSQLHGEQTAHMLIAAEAALIREKPKVVLVGGDANTNLAGALAARKLGIAVGHVEAGLRSHDWRMPEEHNRVMIDHISELLFAPTEGARQNLVRDHVLGEIHVTGNTVVDAVQQNLSIAKTRSDILSPLHLRPKHYVLLTTHREENVDDPSTLKDVFDGLYQVGKKYDFPIVFPVHPRTATRIARFGLSEYVRSIPKLKVVDPVGYLDFLLLLSQAKLVITDSGGIQEEACILRVPCVTIRENTERPETVEVGANVVAGTKPSSILDAVDQMLEADLNWNNPFGDGMTGRRIVEITMDYMDRR